jgi:hypothetical protein
VSTPEPPEAPRAEPASSEPSPPRVPQTATEGIRLIGGLVVVSVGLVVLAVIAVVALELVSDSSEVVAIATAAFAVIGTLVGAYFGLKIGSDGTQAAVAGLKDEAAKAQAFAAHVPADVADKAIEAARGLAGEHAKPGSAAGSGRPAPRRDRP